MAQAVGLACAVELAERERQEEASRLGALRDELRHRIASRFDQVSFNTPPKETAPHILSVSFQSVEGESLVKLLDEIGVAVSTGSACSAGARKPSHVLQAMGRSDRQVRGSLRLSLGRLSSRDQLEVLLERLEEAVTRLERIAPRP